MQQAIKPVQTYGRNYRLKILLKNERTIPRKRSLTMNNTMNAKTKSQNIPRKILSTLNASQIARSPAKNTMIGFFNRSFMLVSV